MYFQGSFVVSNEVDPNDFHRIVEIFIKSFNGEPWFEKWDFDTAKECLVGQMSCGQLIVCRDQNQRIAGFGISLPLSCYSGSSEFLDLGGSIDDYYISELAVDSDYRRNGIARSIISLSVSIGKQKHGNVLLRTRIDNEPMHRIVTQIGFQKIAEYQTVNGGVLSPRIVFRL